MSGRRFNERITPVQQLRNPPPALKTAATARSRCSRLVVSSRLHHAQLPHALSSVVHPHCSSSNAPNILNLSPILSEIIGEEVASSSASNSDIPWTISNKYYTAHTHFHIQTPSKPLALPLCPPKNPGEKVPAILFVWTKGEVSTFQRCL